jgi:hypothetical protein
MRAFRKFPWGFSAVALVVLVGSVVVGLSGSGSASANPTPKTVEANQGLPGGVPWPVSGNVNVANLPALQQVAGVTEVVPGGGSGLLSVTANSELSTASLDVSAFQTVNLYLNCPFSTCAQEIGPGNPVLVFVRTTLPAVHTVNVDTFDITGPGAQSQSLLLKTYTVPGPNLQVDVINPQGNGGVQLQYALVGRTD